LVKQDTDLTDYVSYRCNNIPTWPIIKVNNTNDK